MPKLDGTGPAGAGPKTGGQRGNCTGVNPSPRPMDGRGKGMGQGRNESRGQNQGQKRGGARKNA